MIMAGHGGLLLLENIEATREASAGVENSSMSPIVEYTLW